MIFDVIPIGSRIIDGFIGRSMEKSCIILIIILKTPIRWFIMKVKSKFVCKFIFQLCGFIYATFIFKRFD